ncbi:MAG: hypothetical protein C4289_17795 [Chloroflexota bacterium]
MVVDTKLRVMVHYPAAEEPFKDDSADRSETIGQFKPRVLNAFGLAEGTTPEGNIITYTLYHQKTPLENPNQTLGDLAGDQKILQLKLVQQITQG